MANARFRVAKPANEPVLARHHKAGWHLNLLRWTSGRTIKETFCPPTDFPYPFMGPQKIGPGPDGPS